MKFLSIYKAVERNTPPTQEEMASMGRLIEEGMKAGWLVSTEGCMPSALGARVRVIGPSTLLPTGIDRMGVEVFTDMQRGLAGADIVMMLRLQRERMNGSFVPSVQEYFHYYGLDQKKLAYAKPNALVMHPGPMNRGVEIDTAVADGAQSLIREQVEMGVAVRMAALEALSRTLPNA